MNFEWKPLTSAWNGRERRKSKRQAANQPVRILLPGREITIHGQLLDLSEEGCCVDPLEPFLVWNELRVEIRFEAYQTQFRLAGVTRGNRGGKSFGIEFDSMTAERLEELKQLLPANACPESSIKAQVAFVEPEQTAPIVSTEANTGDTQSQTKKRTSKVAKLTGLVRNEPPPGGKERRVHSRYIVEAQAVLLIVKSGEAMPGYILEMSESGCRVYLDGAFEKEVGTNVEVSFSVHGIPVRVAGVSQVVIDPHTVGIRFQELSGRKQKQLLELIAEIREEMDHAEQVEAGITN